MQSLNDRKEAIAGTAGELRIYGATVCVTQSEIQIMLSDCLKARSKLTSWEWDFVNRVNDKRDTKKPLLSREIDKLYQVWSQL